MISFNHHHNNIISPILQMKALRLKEIKSCIQGCKASSETGQGLDPGSLIPVLASDHYAILQLSGLKMTLLVSTSRGWGEQEGLVFQ